MNEIFEKIYNDNNTDLNESSALFEKVYTEAEMLNEMNPKLRALLAAGLIGTAGLGAVSCSMPTDDPTIYGQPVPGDTKETVTFESLGVTDYAESLARAVKVTFKGETKKYNDVLVSDDTIDLIYREGHFTNALDEDQDGKEDISEHTTKTYICYKDGNIRYNVPESMESTFDAARAAYNNAQ